MNLKDLTFKGGVNVPHYKELSENAPPLERAMEPDVVMIPLHQHTGAPCEPLVKPGDEVKVGQKKLDNLMLLYLLQYIHQYLVR